MINKQQLSMAAVKDSASQYSFSSVLFLNVLYEHGQHSLVFDHVVELSFVIMNLLFLIPCLWSCGNNICFCLSFFCYLWFLCLACHGMDSILFN